MRKIWLIAALSVVCAGLTANADDGNSTDGGPPPLPGWGGQVQLPLFTMTPDPQQLALYVTSHPEAVADGCVAPNVEFFPNEIENSDSGFSAGTATYPQANRVVWWAGSILAVDASSWTCGTVKGDLYASAAMWNAPPTYESWSDVGFDDEYLPYCNDTRIHGFGTPADEQTVCEQDETGYVHAYIDGLDTLTDHTLDYWESRHTRQATNFQWIPPDDGDDTTDENPIALGPDLVEYSTCGMLTVFSWECLAFAPSV